MEKEKSETIKKLEALSSPAPSNWREHAEWRQSNRKWLWVSGKIAVTLLMKFEEGMTREEFCEKTGIPMETLSLMVKGSYDFTLSEMHAIEKTIGIDILSNLITPKTKQRCE